MHSLDADFGLTNPYFGFALRSNCSSILKIAKADIRQIIDVRGSEANTELFG